MKPITDVREDHRPIRRATFFSLLMVLFCNVRVDAGFIYDIYNNSTQQNGYTLSGTITTSELGALNFTGIEAFNLLISIDGTSYALSSNDYYAIVTPAPYNTNLPITATTSSLTFNQANTGNVAFGIIDYTTEVDLSYQGGTAPYAPPYGYFATANGDFLWDDTITPPSTGGFLTNSAGSWIIATYVGEEPTGPAPTPEPASIAMALTGMLGLAGYRLSRRRQPGPSSASSPVTHS
jgi:hypothetical protein